MALLGKDHRIRLDIGNYCNLDCPSCFRQEMTRLYNKQHNTNIKYHPYLNKHNVTLDEVQQWFPKLFLIDHVKEMSLCGASSEASLNPHCIDIVKYFKNYVEVVSVATNGSTNTPNWWYNLGDTKAEAIFTIDSFKQNNNLYRINSNTDKIIENIKAFISSGGNAVLKQILFKHNQDEIDNFIKFADDLGCSYKLMPAAEFDNIKTHYEVLSNKKKYILEKNTIVNKNQEYRKDNSDPQSYCALTKEKTFIIHANGVIYPCCHIEGQFFEIYEDFFIDEKNTSPNINKHPQIVKDFVKKIELQGGIKTLSLKYNDIETILNSSFFKSTLQLSWKLKSNQTCINCKNGSTTSVLNL